MAKTQIVTSSTVVHGMWVFRNEDGKLMFGVDAHDESQRQVFSLKMSGLETRELFEGDIADNKLCIITDRMARQLMDYMWAVGIRPSEVEVG